MSGLGWFVGPYMLLVGGVRLDPFLYFIFLSFFLALKIQLFIFLVKYYFKILFEFNNLFFNYYVHDTKIIMLIINYS